jgi:toluene monooxygenase system protein E
VALNLVLKPMIDELFLKHASDLALGLEDHLLGRIFYSLNEDSQWHRQWSYALIRTATEDAPANRGVIQTWIDKWYRGALRSIDALSPFFEGRLRGLGLPPFQDLTSQIDACCADYLGSMDLRSVC